MRRLLAIILCASVLAGCDDPPPELEEQDNLHILTGQERIEQEQWDDAIREFKAALEEHPQYALPDLNLALIYHEQTHDYARAIYHYQRYLEKRPDTEKAPMISDWIQQAKVLLAAEVGRTGDGIPEEIVRLKRANNLLRYRLRLLATPAPQREETQPPAAATPAPQREEAQPPVAATLVPQPETVEPEPTPVSATPIPRIQTPAPIPETYKVLPGDTLSKIARTIYGDSSKWREIYGANLDQMETPNDLKAGAVIIIPSPKSKEQKPRDMDDVQPMG